MYSVKKFTELKIIEKMKQSLALFENTEYNVHVYALKII